MAEKNKAYNPREDKAYNPEKILSNLEKNEGRLLLIGMFDMGLQDYFYTSGKPVCYSSKISGGYCFIEPPSAYYQEHQKLQDGTITLAPLIDFYVDDLINSAASSAISTGYCIGDIPQIKKRLESDLLLKISGSSFFWFAEPQPYPTGVHRISCLKKELVDLLRTSEELFSGLTINKELHNRGLLFWGVAEDIKKNENLWATEALKAYDLLLATYLRTGEGKDKIEQLEKGVNSFCRIYIKNPEVKKKVILRSLVAKEIAQERKDLARIALVYYDSDEVTLRRDLEQFKEELQPWRK